MPTNYQRKRRYRRRRINRTYRQRRSMLKQPSDSVYLVCESYDQIALPASTTELRFLSNGLTYKNIETILANSLSFTKYSPLYAKMKITGISMSTSPCHGATTYPGSPDYVIGFYPQHKSVGTLANSVISMDSTHYVQPGLTVPQTKYLRFNNQAYEGTDGTGYGTSFSPSVISSLSGQLVVGCVTNLAAQGVPTCWSNLRIKLYIVLSDKIF